MAATSSWNEVGLIPEAAWLKTNSPRWTRHQMFTTLATKLPWQQQPLWQSMQDMQHDMARHFTRQALKVALPTPTLEVKTPTKL